MPDSARRLVGLGLPCLVAYLIAATLTLYANHSLAVVAECLAWPAIIAGLLLLLPEPLAVVLAIAVVFGHVAGAYTLMTPMLGSAWYQIANGMFLVGAATLGTGLYWWVRTSNQSNRGQRLKQVPTWLRWPLIIGLVIAASAIAQKSSV